MTPKFIAKPQVVKQSPRAWYIGGVNINYSFKTLEKLANDMGANVENGDILVVDNANADKRKAFKKTPSGYIIVYAQLFNNVEFEAYKNGKISSGSNVPLIEFFQA